MDHDQVWPANIPPQAYEGLQHGPMQPSPTAQPLPDRHPVSWATGQDPVYPPPFGGPLAHTQRQQHVRANGLLSPAPSRPAVSPPDRATHGVPPVRSTWSPVSPISPTACESMAGGLNNNLEVLFYATMPPGCAMGLDWATDTSFQFNFDQACYKVTTNYSAGPAPHGSFDKPWPGGYMPFTPQPDAAFLATCLGDGVSSYPPGSPSNATQSPNPPRSPPQAQQQQQQQRPTKRMKTQTTRNPDLPSNPATAIPTQQTREPTFSTRTSANTITPPMKPPSSSGASAGSGSGAGPGPSLRTAPRRFKRPSPSPKPGETPEHQRARTNHNLVEQQYRHRLHTRFEALLEVLPEVTLDEVEVGTEGGDPDGERGIPSAAATASSSSSSPLRKAAGGGKHKRMSKVDVLSRAARVIRALERDNIQARREVEALRREREAAMTGRGASAAASAAGG